MSRTAAPLQTDLFLWQSLRIRRQRDEPPRGLDAAAGRWVTRAKHSRAGMKMLYRESAAVVAMEKKFADMTDTTLDETITQVRETFSSRNYGNEAIQLGMATVREVAYRERGERPYQVQIMGAMGMLLGQIVEMVTGEGKTLTASLAATMLGWRRRPVHLITVNDYLAERDAQEMSPIYNRCGLKAGWILEDTPPQERAEIYRLPIVATTQKQLVADWLRDQLRLGRTADPVSTRWLIDGQQQRGQDSPVLVPGLYAAIVDELDAVLIDEAVTPLIIAQPRGEESQAALYERARDLANALDAKRDFEIDQLKRKATLRPSGREIIASMLDNEEHAIWRAKRRREELVEQALVAKCCYHHGQQYQIVEDRVMIVDEYTGRFMPDREWQHGLHQAVEAKHELPVTADRDTLASLSFQRFFRLYPHLCGMTGTAADAKGELESTYEIPVRVIPTHRPLQRVQLPDQIFATEALKWQAVANEIQTMHDLGRPVLVGTRSIEASEGLGELLRQRNLEHQVLNAVHHKEEAEIITGAGQHGQITVATNMAGRGTDIKLGPGVKECGGLHVILTEIHTASRIDRQLIGRAGRQGDPGSARAILSLEDDLLLRYTPRSAATMRRIYGKRTDPLPTWLRKLFRQAQRRAEWRASSSRRSVLKREMQLDRALPG